MERDNRRDSRWNDYREEHRRDPYRDDYRRESHRREDYRDDHRREGRPSGQRSAQQSRKPGSNSRRTPMARKKQKRSPLSNSMIYILVVCGISAILATVGWTMANDMLALNKDYKEAVITVGQDKDFGSVVDQLDDNGIINYKFLFRLFAVFSGGPDKITQGAYNLNTNMDYRAILNSMGSNSSNRTTATVTITEGMTVDQIFKLLEKNGVSTVEKLQDMAANHDYAFSFLQDIPMGDYKRLEGYLFPDTYEFYTGEDPKYVLNKMLVNFDAKVTDSLRQQIKDKGYTIHEIITIASLIEGESDGTDRGKISSVIHNRLNNPNGGTMGYLQIDAALKYVLPEGQKVTASDYDNLDSPYNTYQHKGLPPGPIGNPGMESILAAMNPEKTNYFYYILGDDEVHHFFATHAEFEAFKNS
ncbi:MAG: endolytic transglycosylase MltG [Evtepia sp.]|uniref:endolytic transglycosylase MltG n=1 Tax=Evtepia sp. TaxID=2773933 RepID=UPI002A7600A1|nr:endolytic transglycosylase MltG [Evtepia sp.]MDY3013903.1 endolytic transglycosylase MltG [Evtepia sp.]